MNAPTRRAPRPATALTLLAAASLAASAAAQEAPRDGAAMALEEIVVTARMREESLQNAPIAISAYTGASLAFNLAGIFGASLAPYIATWLATHHGVHTVGLYLSGAALLTLAALWQAPESTAAD